MFGLIFGLFRQLFLLAWLTGTGNTGWLIAVARQLNGRRIEVELSYCNHLVVSLADDSSITNARRLLGVGRVRQLDIGSGAGAGEQVKEPPVAETAANELVLRQDAVSVGVHSLEDLPRPHLRHLAVLGRLVVGHQIDRLNR